MIVARISKNGYTTGGVLPGIPNAESKRPTRLNQERDQMDGKIKPQAGIHTLLTGQVIHNAVPPGSYVRVKIPLFSSSFCPRAELQNFQHSITGSDPESVEFVLIISPGMADLYSIGTISVLYTFTRSPR